MHPTSAENMERCIRLYLNEFGRGLRIADLGSQSVNGSYRSLFNVDVEYVGFDLEAGAGVDIVLDSPYCIPAENASFDLVISGQMLEHCPHFWLLASEIQRILKAGALAFLIAPSAGPVHRYPVDCYRFYPDAWHALADWAGLHLVDLWIDERGPWCDLVGVFGKDTKIDPIKIPPAMPLISQGGQGRKEAPCFAQLINEILEQRQPMLCVEVGTAGPGLLPTTCGQRILIESGAKPSDLPSQDLAFDCTADDFFFFIADNIITTVIDLAVIDGGRAAASILRDVMSLERRMSPNGLIVVADDRLAGGGGTVATIASLLGTERPDLELGQRTGHDCRLLTISGLQPSSTVLWQRYNPLVRKLQPESPEHSAEHQHHNVARSGV